MRLDIIGLDGEGLVVACHGLLQLPKVTERTAKVIMRLGEIELDGEGLTVAGNGLIQLPQFPECIAKIVMRLGVISLDGEGIVIACHGLIQPPQFFERIAKVVMRLGVIGLDGEGLRDEFNGDLTLTYLMGGHTKQMQGDRVIGVGLQYLSINVLSVRQATRIVVLHGEIYGLLYG